ncbi:hypothetical protein ACLQ3K_19785 [Tsukamurella sp. DT100]|uniref:hypothetical protein n=1 Tax=Tsukamurella sp. DT100 TaxID=3393415 RepID=UPI003CF12D87
MAAIIRFRPEAHDARIIQAAKRDGECKSDVIRRARRLLEREAWLTQARHDAERLAKEVLSNEPDAW